MTHNTDQNLNHSCCSKLAHKRYSKVTQNHDSKSDPEKLVKKCSINVTQNWHTHTVLKIDPKTLLKSHPPLLLKIYQQALP